MKLDNYREIHGGKLPGLPLEAENMLKAASRVDAQEKESERRIKAIDEAASYVKKKFPEYFKS